MVFLQKNGNNNYGAKYILNEKAYPSLDGNLWQNTCATSPLLKNCKIIPSKVSPREDYISSEGATRHYRQIHHRVQKAVRILCW